MNTVKSLLVFAVIFAIFGSTISLIIDPNLRTCVQCLCHARTGCWRRRNCAQYSIGMDYWKIGGSLEPSPENPGLDENGKFEKCMKNEDCIVGTIINYTESFGEIDCNCDGTFDCKDRFAIHLFGKNCPSPVYGKVYAKRFNDCATRSGVKEMLPQEGSEDCGPEAV